MTRFYLDAPQLHNHKQWAVAALVLYVGLVIYGSLFPLTNWRTPEGDLLAFLVAPLPRYITRTDIVTNILAYLPVGFLVAATLRSHMRLRRAVLWAMLAGLILSLAMETLQMFLPSRIASNLDVVTNTIGAVLGAVLFRFAEFWRWPGQQLLNWRTRWFMAGPLANFGLLLLCVWALSQLSLQLPSLVAGNLHARFMPFWETWVDLSRFSLGQALVYCLEITGLGLFTAVIIKPGHRMIVLLFALLSGAIALKFLAVAILIKFSALARLLSLEALTGLAAGLLIVALVVSSRRLRRPYLPATMALSGFVLAKFMQGAVQGVREFQWLELPSSMFNVIGLARLFSDIWPFLAMGFLATHWVLSVVRTHQSKPAKERRLAGDQQKEH